MVDFEWYRSFVAVYQLGTVSAAAEQRGMTQPTLSQHLAALEAAHGSRLFTRTPRQMRPTESGKLLYSQVIGSVEQLERLADKTSVAARRQKVMIRLGGPQELFHTSLLPRLPERRLDDYRLQLVTGQTRSLLRQLEMGDLDAIVATQHLAQRSLHYIPLMVEEFILVGPADLQTLSADPQDEYEKWLLSQMWIAYAPDLPIIRRYWQQAFQHRPNILPSYILPDLRMIVRAVELGMGITVLPQYLCREALQNGTIQVLWQPALPVTNQLYGVCLRSRLHSPEMEWLQGLWLAMSEKA